MITCPICKQPKANLDGHHIYPTGYGGPFDGPLFKLCASCHQDVHRQAETLILGNKTFVMPEINFKRADLAENGRLISSIIKAHSNYQQGIIPTGGSLKNHEVHFNLTRQKLDLLHKTKIAVGANSLQSLMEHMVDVMIRNTLGVDPNQNESLLVHTRRIKSKRLTKKK